MSSDQFYNKGTGNRPTRRESVLIIDSAGRNKQSNPDREADHYLRKNLKLFVILLLTMVSLLVIGIKYVEYQWGRRDRQTRSSYNHQPGIAAPAVLSTNRPVRTRALDQSLPSPTAVSGIPANGEAVETILRWGRILEDAGELKGAVDRYSEALKIDPENVEALTRIGRLEIRMSLFSNAVETLSFAHELSTDDPDIMNDLGVAYTFDGQLDSAVEIYDRLLETIPGYTPALFNHGYALLQRGDADAAYPLLERYLQENPDDSMALGVMAILELQKDRPERALERLDRAIEVAPDWITPYLDAATVCAQLERNERAIEYMDRALGIAEPSVVYKRFQSGPFESIRLSDEGKDLEARIARRAREVMEEN